MVGLMLASGITASARDSGAVLLNQNVVVHGTTLPPGRYHVRWESHSPEATVEFTNGSKVVLSTNGKYEDRGRAYSRNMIVTETATDGTQRLMEVRFAGSSKVLTFD
jgi:hypothetical protein